MPEPKADIRARLFDADRTDRRLAKDELLDLRPSERQLLWVDVSGGLPDDDADRLARWLDLSPRTRTSLQHPDGEPMVALHREYLHVRVAANPSDRDPGETAWLEVIAARNIVLTVHDGPIDFLDDVDKRIHGDAAAGILSSAAFFTAIVDAAITSYHAAVDRIEADVDRLDADSLEPDVRRDLLADLVRARRRIARLRRALADHRSVFTALAAPDVTSVVDDPDAGALFQGLAARFEGAIGAVEDSREALLGSFDVYMSRTAQRTNDVMKVLTLATVLLLPGSLVAGLLGMNVVVPLPPDDPSSFWIALAAIGILALGIVAVARARHWL